MDQRNYEKRFMALLLGMQPNKVVALWEKEGRPLIALDDGTRCRDLESLLKNKNRFFKHYPSIQNWLVEIGGYDESVS